jgi:hypothetical protein
MSDVGSEATSVKELHESLTFHVLKSGVGEKGWERLIKNFSRKSIARQCLIIDFLKSLKANEWKGVNDVWTMQNATPEMWENMQSMFDESAFPEMILLRRAQRKLKERWLAFKEQLKQFIQNEKSTDDDSDF